jgi:glycosyltransferase involved in cell wall biosynthesis
MRILFLLSSLEPAGSETYCVSLADAWRGKHEIFWISDFLHFGQPYLSLPIHLKAIPMGVFNAAKVASFIRQKKIDVIHSHSRRAHWVAAQAARLTQIPHVTTIHQPPPVHFFSQWFPCLGDQTIAIDEAVADHLRQNFKRSRSPIHLIRNGIDLSRWLPTPRLTPNIKDILVIGRLSGGRWAAFQLFLETLARLTPMLPAAHYKVVGFVPQERRESLTQQLLRLAPRLRPSTVEIMGFLKNLPDLIRNSDGVIAAGRSALEAIAQGRAVVLLGEGGPLGLCRPEIWNLSLRTNLGDHQIPKNMNPAALESGLRALLSPRADQADINHWCRTQVEKHFDLRGVAAQVEDVYQRALRR